MPPRIALSLGDPAGVGPELCCRVCADPAVLAACEPVVVGNRALIERVAEQLKLPVPNQIDPPQSDTLVASTVTPGSIDPQCGAAALSAFAHAVAGCRSGRYAAVTTAPINKQAIAAAGCPHPGHTELLAEHCGGGEPVMLLYDPSIAVALVTVHQSLASVPASLSSAAIERVGRLLAAALGRIRNDSQPRIAVLGLNPHAGEGGLFGDEEARLVSPAVAALRAAGIEADGPLPPDTAFTARARSYYAGHVCLYHDQGLIPFKALAFADGVNVTLGLPVVRTSPDHGTAFDIAWKGIADPASMRAAVLLAAQLAS
ncbi:MAG: 4-hydroxythreonine-4-phosphate dehydrogenase PdxA [Planctomycetota bacterium]|jgi:4-hydroxythreonine-4-phosphate dehydrogenase|nr:4-hydroxythreonine-4-phosphate dehydrogenase PdxA [Planctomycetota bacterium]